ncbi:TetR family transcriptional regulator [Agromyces sp. CFH 90414]|uniref:TetR family transcriptional regulator n=1 Tax=Agromyces agglutinans TaxID=2662258 RepID=A0A6I2EZ45_9MICO|nr:TetR/AcrR family transcriptional regulator [Agromyces agglutinans]MRG58395.1 TetR family transcriptional regulator [Agromyces agglutinans]
MPRELSEYHRQVASTNRASILDAATPLFLEFGYDRTSLARVAERAGVSKATLFKQFPTKAALFEAAVLAVGDAPDAALVEPVTSDFRAGLVELGLAYTELLARPGIAEFIRTIIAESPRFPELRERTFDFGTLPVLAALDRYLRAQTVAGAAAVDDPMLVATQFLGMIASSVFWPRLVHGTWSLDDEGTRTAVEEAATTIAARFATQSTRSHRTAKVGSDRRAAPKLDAEGNP